MKIFYVCFLIVCFSTSSYAQYDYDAAEEDYIKERWSNPYEHLGRDTRGDGYEDTDDSNGFEMPDYLADDHSRDQKSIDNMRDTGYEYQVSPSNKLRRQSAGDIVGRMMTETIDDHHIRAETDELMVRPSKSRRRQSAGDVIMKGLRTRKPRKAYVLQEQ